MRYLIDTNLFIRLVEDDVSDDIRRIVFDCENTFYISSESVKEFIHLAQIGKIAVPKNKRLDVFRLIEAFQINVKYVREEHLRTLEYIERVAGHNDPSDRLIIAQAITEKLPLISSDKMFSHYKKQGLNLILSEKK